MNLYVGVRVERETLNYCGLTNEQDSLFEGITYNNIAGANAIKQLIIKAESDNTFDQILVGLQSTTLYDLHPGIFLKTDRRLRQLGIKVVTIKSYSFEHFNQDFMKTASYGARLANYLRAKAFTTPLMVEEKTSAMQRLTRERYHLIKQIVDTKNDFLNNLYYRSNLLSSADTTPQFDESMMSLLLGESLTLDEAAAMSLHDLIDLLSQLSGGQFGNAKIIARLSSKTTSATYNVDAAKSDSLDLLLGVYVQILKSLNHELASVNQAIDKTCAILSGTQTLRSIPGMGNIYAAGIIAEIGQIQRFKNEGVLARYAGLGWVPHSADSDLNSDAKLNRKGNEYLGYYFVEAANKLRRFDSSYQAFFLKKAGEVPSHGHHRAAILTGRKIVGLVDVLLRRNELYVARLIPKKG